MRILHSRKLIFLANPKTGSTTVRNVLDPYSDVRSVHISETSEACPFYNHIPARELRGLFRVRGWDWDGYTKFCVVRNPYDRTVSLYHHYLMLRRNINVRRPMDVLRKLKNAMVPALSFKAYVMRIDPESTSPTSLQHFICDEEGRHLVENVLMLERLSDELPAFLERFDISITAGDIPHLNAAKSRQTYSAYYDEATKTRVRELYAYEIERFGYTF